MKFKPYKNGKDYEIIYSDEELAVQKEEQIYFS